MIKKIIKTLDRKSVYPIFYSFIMTKPEQRLFDKYISQAKFFLEFGLGGSSIRALKKSQAKVYSVESSLDWIEYMRGYRVISKAEASRLHISYVNIGATKEWGFPLDSEPDDRFRDYSSKVFEELDCSSVDLILVDGRFRVACTLMSLLKCNKPNLKIMIHDFWKREEYHIVLQYLEVVDKIDNLVVCERKHSIDENQLMEDYKKYQSVVE